MCKHEVSQGTKDLEPLPSSITQPLNLCASTNAVRGIAAAVADFLVLMPLSFELRWMRVMFFGGADCGTTMI